MQPYLLHFLQRPIKIYGLTPDRFAAEESIACHPLRTTTHRNMVDNIANSVGSTCTFAGINTFISNTCLVSRAISA